MGMRAGAVTGSDLKVKYDELVQYTLTLEKEKKKMEEKDPTADAMQPQENDYGPGPADTAMRAGAVTGSDLKVKYDELLHYFLTLEKEKLKMEEKLEQEKKLKVKYDELVHYTLT